MAKTIYYDGADIKKSLPSTTPKATMTLIGSRARE